MISGFFTITNSLLFDTFPIKGRSNVSDSLHLIVNCHLVALDFSVGTHKICADEAYILVFISGFNDNFNSILTVCFVGRDKFSMSDIFVECTNENAENIETEMEWQRYKTWFRTIAAESSEDEDKSIDQDNEFHVEPYTQSLSSPTDFVDLKIRGKDLQKITGAMVLFLNVFNSMSDRATASIVNVTLRADNIPEIIDKLKVCKAVNTIFE